MTDKELKNIISQGEGEKLEFKSNFNNELIETLVAFANKHGGKIIVGINQKVEISGVIIKKETIQNWINEIKNKTAPSLIPDVEIVNYLDRTLVVFSVQEYPIKPIATRGKYFKRIANSNHLMSLEEIANEHLRTVNSSWDYYIDPGHGIESISVGKVQRFILGVEKQTQNKIEVEPLDFLTKLEIIRDNQLTFAGFLLFAKEYCLISDVQVGRLKGDTIIIDSLSLSTDLFTEIDEILSFIKKHLMVEYIITGEPQHIERFDYPVDAIREIVINMVVHRDYRDSSGSIIKIFDDRIEFFNPGKLYGGITIQDLLSDNYTSQCRNKLIANAFKETGLIERYGEFDEY
jgi:ATP-dependent DNA helicase RecG